MPKLFLLSSTHDFLLFSCYPPEMFNMDISKFVFLKENRVTSKNYSIEYYETIDECIINCDFSIVLNSNHIPQKSIDSTLLLSRKYGKKSVLLDKVDFKDEYETLPNNLPYSEKPVIAILYSGVLSLPSILEFNIQEWLKQHSITVHQVLSAQTLELKNQLIKNELVSSRNNQTDSEYAYDLIVYSLNMGDNLQFLDKCITDCRSSLPDYIFVLTRCDQLSMNEYINNKLKYCVSENIKVNYLFSKYHILPEEYKVFCAHKAFCTNKIRFLDEIRFHCIFDELLSNITFPRGIVPIQIK
jgi:hypothetical protein